MSKDLKWMLLGIFLAVVSVWCLLIGGISALLSVFVLILAVGFFAGGYTYGHSRKKEPPDYPIENIEQTENIEKEQES